MSKISGLPNLDLPDGAERVPVLKGGKTWAASLAALIAGAVAPFASAPQLRRALAASTAAENGADAALLMAQRGILIEPIAGTFIASGQSKSSLAALGIVAATRAGGAYALDAAGLYQSFAADQLRSTTRGILLESAATNLVTGPTDFTTGWSTSNGIAYTITRTPGQAPAIDGAGALLGTKMTSANAQAAGISHTTVGTPGAGTFTYSLIMKKGDVPFFSMGFLGPFGQTPSWDVDWSGAVPVVTYATGLNNSATVQMLANGIARFSFTIAPTNATALRFNCNARVSSGGAGYNMPVGTVLGTFYHEQLEAGSIATSPIIAGGATRPADDAAIALGAGPAKDRVAIAYEGGSATLVRSALVSATSLDLVRDGGAPWAGGYITSIALAPALDRALLAVTENGCAPYFADWDGTRYFNRAIEAGASGVFFATAADVEAAAGMTRLADGTRLLGGYVAPDAVNLLGVVDFGIDTQRFTAGNGTLATEGGYLSLAGDGTAAFVRARRQMQLPPSMAVRVTATIKRGTSTRAYYVAATTYNTNFDVARSSDSTNSATDKVLSTEKSVNNGKLFVGFRSTSNNPDSGTTLFRNVIVQEARPARGFPNGRFMVELRAIMPAALPAAAQVLWQGDTGSDTLERTTLEWRTDGSIWLVSRTENNVVNSFTSSLQIGAAAAGATVRIVAGCDPSTMRGAVSGSVASELDTDNGMGFSRFRIGRNIAGAAFAGTISDVIIWSECETAAWMTRRVSTILPADSRHLLINGDSYSTVGSTGIGTYLAALGYKPVSIGVGGSTFAQQNTALLTGTSLVDFGSYTYVRVDGDPNGRSAAALVSGYIVGTTLTVTAVTSGALAVDQLLGFASVGIGGQFVVAQLSGTAGGVGTYQLASAQTLGTAGAPVAISAWPELVQYKAEVAALGHQRHLYYRSGRISNKRAVGNTSPCTSRNPDDNDMDSIFAAIGAFYGDAHVYDPWPISKTLAIKDLANAGYAADQSDIAFGYDPRSIKSDGVHNRAAAKRVIAADMVAKLETVRRL